MSVRRGPGAGPALSLIRDPDQRSVMVELSQMVGSIGEVEHGAGGGPRCDWSVRVPLDPLDPYAIVEARWTGPAIARPVILGSVDVDAMIRYAAGPAPAGLISGAPWQLVEHLYPLPEPIAVTCARVRTRSRRISEHCTFDVHDPATIQAQVLSILKRVLEDR